jgi:hypothetical protein
VLAAETYFTFGRFQVKIWARKLGILIDVLYGVSPFTAITLKKPILFPHISDLFIITPTFFLSHYLMSVIGIKK